MKRRLGLTLFVALMVPFPAAADEGSSPVPSADDVQTMAVGTATTALPAVSSRDILLGIGLCVALCDDASVGAWQSPSDQVCKTQCTLHCAVGGQSLLTCTYLPLLG